MTTTPAASTSGASKSRINYTAKLFRQLEPRIFYQALNINQCLLEELFAHQGRDFQHLLHHFRSHDAQDTSVLTIQHNFSKRFLLIAIRKYLMWASQMLFLSFDRTESTTLLLLHYELHSSDFYMDNAH